MDYLAKLRKGRESKVEVGGFVFTIRRPTDLEAIDLQTVTSTLDGVRQVLRFVVDWHGVKGTDIVPDGEDKAVPFDSELFAMWVEDQPAIWGDLVAAVYERYTTFTETRDDAGNG